MSLLPICMFIHHVVGANRGPNKESDLLKLELQRVMGHHVGAGNQTQFSALIL